MNCLKDENVVWYRWLDKRVCAKGTLFGTLKYFGCTKFSDGLWCGIELDEPVGKNDGMVNNVKYFTCLPKFGIFVPVSKVCRIESNSKNSNDTFRLLNETVVVQNSQVSTTLKSSSDSQACNNNKETEGINEIKEEKTENIRRQDSEESLGLLDPNLIESWDSFNLDDIVPDFPDNLLDLQTLELDFADQNLPAVEISNPKYASTPRNPVKKRFIENHTEEMGYASQNDVKYVFKNQIDCEQDVFFDTEKLKNNPYLTSTSEFFQIPDVSSNKDVKVLSPISCSSISESNNLNKTQILAVPFLTNHDIIIPVSMDLNKTQTLQNGCQAIVSNMDVLSTTITLSTETDAADIKNLNLTVSLQASEDLENCKKICELKTLPDITSCRNVNFNSKIDGNLSCIHEIEEVKTNLNSYSECDLNKQDTSDTCLSKTLTDNSSSPQSNDVNKNESRLQKIFVSDPSLSIKKCNNDPVKCNVQFKPLNCKSKLLEETIVLEKSLSDVDIRSSISKPVERRLSTIDLKSTFKNKSKVTSNVSVASESQKNMPCIQLRANNFDKKTNEFKKPLAYSSFRKSKAPAKKCTKENGSFTENVSVSKPKAPEVPFKSSVNTTALQLKQQKKDLKLYSDENKSAISRKSSVLTRRFSLSQSSDIVKPNTAGNLPLQNKNSKISNRLSSSATLPTLATNNLDVHSKVPLNNVKSLVFSKKVIEKNSNKPVQNPVVVNSDEIVTAVVKPKNCLSAFDSKLEQEKENKKFDAIKNKSLPSCKTLVYKRRFSYSQGSDTAEGSSSTDSLPSKVDEKLEISKKIKCLASDKAMPSKSNLSGISKVPLNNIKSTVPVKKASQISCGIAKPTSLPQSKEPVSKNKLAVNQQDSWLSSKECGILKRNSLAPKQKTNLPVHRYSMLPLIKEINLCEAKKPDHVEQITKSDGNLIPEAVHIDSSCSIANSSKPSRIASSLPQQSQIATRKMGLKSTDVKEECDGPKIPRYNLRGRK